MYLGRSIPAIRTRQGVRDNYLFDDDALPDISIYNEDEGTFRPSFDYEVNFTPEMRDLAKQLGNEQSARGINIPGTSLRADIQPAKQSLMNTLYLIGAVAVLVYLMRSK